MFPVRSISKSVGGSFALRVFFYKNDHIVGCAVNISVTYMSVLNALREIRLKCTMCLIILFPSYSDTSPVLVAIETLLHPTGQQWFELLNEGRVRASHVFPLDRLNARGQDRSVDRRQCYLFTVVEKMYPAEE